MCIDQLDLGHAICHYYWLIDQKINGKILQNDEWFSAWLVDYMNLWGTFLDSTESFSQEILNTFIDNSPMYRVEDSMLGDKPNNPSGWLTFNQFFARTLNPGLRPIADPTDNTVIVSPAECTYRAQYDIGSDSSMSSVETGDSTIRLKKTFTFGNITKLLEGSEYRHAFAGGKFVHYYLSTYSYHHFHTPVSGTIKECYPIHGHVYLQVVIDEGGQFYAPDDSTDGPDGMGYQFTQARGVITIDTTNSPYGDVGIVAVIPVGMSQVSSVHMTAVPGTETMKGDDFGHFMFGGSDIIVLFQEHVKAQIDDAGGYRHYGTPIARLHSQNVTSSTSQ